MNLMRPKDIQTIGEELAIKWDDDQVAGWVSGFCEDARILGLHDLSADEFIRHFDLMGVQRHLKAAGIFARLLHRDGKTGYMKDVPRTLAYITDIADHYDELSFLGGFVANRVLPALEDAS